MATKEEEHILNIKVSYDKAVEGIRAYRAEIEALKQREKALSEELENGTVTRQEYDKEAFNSIKVRLKRVVLGNANSLFTTRFCVSKVTIL